MQEALVVRREAHIPAPPATVFAFLTDQEKLLRWMGTEAQVRAALRWDLSRQRHGSSLRPRFLPRGGAGPPPGLQLRLGRQRSSAAGV
jgi:hypothetical protein